MADIHRFTCLLHQFQVHFLQGMGGGFHRADVCACLNERAHERRVLFIGVLQDGLTVKGVPATYEYLWLGIAVIIAMTINVLVRRVRLGSGRA